MEDRGLVGSGVRLTELLAALSLGTDLGMGHPMEHVLRQSFIVLRLAERLGLDDGEREVVYYSSLLAWVGCHVDAYEQAKWFGDDQALKHDLRFVDAGRPVARGGVRDPAHRQRPAAGQSGRGWASASLGDGPSRARRHHSTTTGARRTR